MNLFVVMKTVHNIHIFSGEKRLNESTNEAEQNVSTKKKKKSKKFKDNI